MLRIRRIGTHEEVVHRRSDDLLHLRSDEHASDAYKLKLGQGDDAGGEEPVDDVDAKEEGLRKEAEADMDLD